MYLRLALFAVCLFFGTGAAFCAPQYRLAKTIPLGAPDRWDYVVYDASSHRVYIAHGDRVSVLDGLSGTILGTVSSFPGGTHGIAIAANSGRAYTDDGKAGMVHAFDPSIFKLLNQIPAALDADGMVFDSTSGHVFVNDGDSGKITVVDPMTDTAIANIDGGGAVEYSAVDGHGRLFVNGEEKNEIIAIDTAANKVVAHYPMPTCERPHGLAIDSDSERLFSTCANGVMVVVDGKSGANIASLPIGNRSDAAAFDPKRKLAFSSNGEGTITIVREKDAQSFEVAGTVKTAAGARTMAIDPETGRLFLVTADVSGGAPSNTSTAKSGINFVPGTVKLLIFDPQD